MTDAPSTHPPAPAPAPRRTAAGPPPRPAWNEADRLAALDRYRILDTPPEAGFDDLVALVSDLLGAPIAVVNLIAAGRQWFKAEVGLGLRETPLDVSICAHAILQPGGLVVPDTTKDGRFAGNPLVAGAPGLRFYAGELLETPEGLPLGTLCVLDTVPRPGGLTPRERSILRTAARQVMSQLELRRALHQRDEAIAARRADDTRQAALLELGERLRSAGTAAEMALAAAEIAGRTLSVDRAGFGTVDPVARSVAVAWDWTAPGAGSAAGCHVLTEYGRFGEAVLRGEDVAVEDVAAHPLTAERAEGFRAYGIGALANLAMVEEGRVAAVFFLHAAAPRDWPPEELGFARGVADQARAAMARHAAEDRLRALNASLEAQVEQRTRALDRAWQLSQDLLVVAEADGTLAAVNGAWTALLGWEAAALVGRHFAEFTHPDDLAATQAAFDGIVRAPLTEPFTFRLRHRDARWRWFAWTGAFEGGQVYASGRHVTAEREGAEALAQAEEALRQAQKMEAVGQLTGGIAHDFNNLLTGIVGSLELMGTRLAQGRAAEMGRYLAAAQGAAARAAALTHRLLAFSRRQTLDPRPTALDRLAAGMEELIRRTVGPAITVQVAEPDGGGGGLWATLCDPHQLENVLLNLCINARDAMPDGGRLTVETANARLDAAAARMRGVAAGEYVVMCVTDTGTGMPPEVVDRAFEPFFTTKPIGQGTGLGLSMAYGFARQSGGAVRILSAPGEGTTVRVYLPRHHGAAEAGAPEAGPSGTALARAARHETVLVVDDEPTVRMLAAEVLQDLGYAVLEAEDGPSGLRILDSDAPVSLLMTDVGLPGGMNGRQLADAARVRRPGLKVLFITGYAEAAVVGKEGLEPGMGVMTKPFGLDALAERIRGMLAG